VYEASLGGYFQFYLRFHSEASMTFTNVDGKLKGFTETEESMVTL
jgi:hypothetical protein